jgi:excisionase family DNA binding protein
MHPQQAEQGGQASYYLVDELAALLRVNPATIYREIAAGRLRALRVGVGRGTWRIAAADFDAYREAARS